MEISRAAPIPIRGGLEGSSTGLISRFTSDSTADPRNHFNGPFVYQLGSPVLSGQKPEHHRHGLLLIIAP